jgi:hypothetical protein
MFLHPVVGLFLIVLLGALSCDAVLREGASANSLWTMFAFVSVIYFVAFFWQAIRAKKLIQSTVNRSVYDVASGDGFGD